MNFTCPKCSREIKGKGNLTQHVRACDGTIKVKIIGGMKGKTYEEMYGEERAKELKSHLSQESKKWQNDPNNSSKEKHSIAVSEGMKRKYENGWAPRCGRAKKITYISPVAGKISVDGTWELKVAKYLDTIGVNWSRNTKRFSYQNLNGSQSTYCPDFYINEWDSYLEVKGYETDLDRCKWSQFPNKLIIWKKDEIDKLSSGLIVV